MLVKLQVRLLTNRFRNLSELALKQLISNTFHSFLALFNFQPQRIQLAAMMRIQFTSVQRLLELGLAKFIYLNQDIVS